MTSIKRPDKLLKHCSGEVSEWFKELVLKTSDSERGRGFESHLLRWLRTHKICCADELGVSGFTCLLNKNFISGEALPDLKQKCTE